MADGAGVNVHVEHVATKLTDFSEKYVQGLNALSAPPYQRFVLLPRSFSPPEDPLIICVIVSNLYSL